MAEADPGLKFNGVLLRPEKVTQGMTVALALEGQSDYVRDWEGQPLVFRALIGGVAPVRLRFYSATIDGNLTKDRVVGADVGDFKPGVRLMPVEVFKPGELPPDRKMIAYRGGERLAYEGDPTNKVEITTDATGKALSSNGYERTWLGREYPIPEDAILVPVDIVKKANDSSPGSPKLES